MGRCRSRTTGRRSARTAPTVVRCALGAPEVLGGGRIAYGVLRVRARPRTSLGHAACDCADRPKFGPGVPSALMIPFDSRFDTVWPALGT